jgi:hypothetical protein
MNVPLLANTEVDMILAHSKESTKELKGPGIFIHTYSFRIY